MDKRLLILGAGVYGLVAKEIAESMGCFSEISFVDDHAKVTANGIPVLGTVSELGAFAGKYTHAIVAIGRSEARLQAIEAVRGVPALSLVSLVSPLAYVAPSAKISEGCVIEPMAVVHTGAMISDGCLVSAGAVINHFAVLGRGVHVDCNAVVAGNTAVADGMKIEAAVRYVGTPIT